MSKNYIAIDLGATSGRVILARRDADALDLTTVYRFPTPMLEIDGKWYWNIYTLYDEIVKGLTAVGKMNVKVSSIGVDTWGVDFVCVGKDGSFLGLPRAYRDPYTNGIPEKFFKKMDRKDLYMRTGIQIMNFNSVFQLYAQHKAKGTALANAKKILFMPDAISYMLCGKAVCEYTILSTSALMDPVKKKLDKRILDICGLKRRRFGDMVFPGKSIGHLNESLAAKTGLGKVTIVAVGGHDTASAVAAVPATEPHFAYLSSGTWSLMGVESEAPVVNEVTYDHNFTNEGGVSGNTRLLKNITGMWLLEQCLKKWREEGRDYSYAQIAEMAAACPASTLYINPDNSTFASPTDMPAAIRNYCNYNNIPVPEDDAHMARLIFDSLAAKYAEVLRSLDGIAPYKSKVLHIIGGGSNNDFLNQLTANACGIPVIAGPSEATALGNVMIQAGMNRSQIAACTQTKKFNPQK